MACAPQNFGSRTAYDLNKINIYYYTVFLDFQNLN